MPAFPEATPPEGLNVSVTLANGASVSAYWDGVRFWAGIPDEPNDLPLDSSQVISWDYFSA